MKKILDDSILRYTFGLQRCHGSFIICAFGNNRVDQDLLCLPWSREPHVRLLPQLQVESQSQPCRDMPAVLQIRPVAD